MNGKSNAPSSSYMIGSKAVGNNIKPATLHGFWRKDLKSSDMESFHCAMEAMQLSKVQKTAALKLMDGLHLHVEEEKGAATLKFLTRIPYFKVTETYYKGKETQMPRRDQRRGQQNALAHEITPRNMHVEIRWDGECPAIVRENFVLNESGQLVVEGAMEINGRERINVYQVYNRCD